VIRSVRLGKSVRAAVAVACVAGAAVAVSVGTAGAASTGLVINEVYGGGGNSGATFTNDFIEISNRGSSSASVAGDSVQYHSSGATGSWQTTPLSGTIPAGGIYLVAESQGTGGTQPLPSPQATGMIAMSATAGTVALVNGTTALTCTASAACESASIDLVGYGTAALSEGSPAIGASNTQSASRTDAADSDNNSADFTAADPTPGAANAGTGTGTGTGNPPPTAGPLRIHDIQGTSFVSPDDGKTVTNVPGIVTGIRGSGSSKGYWIQDPTPDDNPATSEGIFVFTSSPTGAGGDSRQVSRTR
jgi:predicted extracellular nuclease